ncbi:MarC family protein [Spirochaeta thermophila]|uniref:UPF0056 inner membrane protein n=1 Tax=Winmispira thermophila (strain ATCC 49972 / DSM 6192 / RI 19.B1) TaxID=665571 RepID=E0RN25_WINT6|nr:MarC family protein [Spirochaeta thermophila]ADN02494.1 hypothetical protein STHERM_c15540 [Spirochaeta thermophila DSM 6192]
MNLWATMITLLLIMDPFGNIPAFLAVLKNYTSEQRRRIIIREMFIALAVLLIFLLSGNLILDAMQIKKPALGIAGGVVLFFIAIRMIFPGTGSYTEEESEPLIVPLAVPFIAGPSAIAMITLLSTRYPAHRLELGLALGGAWLVSVLVLLGSELFQRLLGKNGLEAVERLMGMLLTAMAAQMLLDGIRDYLALAG